MHCAELFKELLSVESEGRSVSECMRTVVLFMIRHNHPVKHWAPFTIMGSPTLQLFKPEKSLSFSGLHGCSTPISMHLDYSAMLRWQSYTLSPPPSPKMKVLQNKLRDLLNTIFATKTNNALCFRSANKVPMWCRDVIREPQTLDVPEAGRAPPNPPLVCPRCWVLLPSRKCFGACVWDCRGLLFTRKQEVGEFNKRITIMRPPYSKNIIDMASCGLILYMSIGWRFVKECLLALPLKKMFSG